MSTCAIARQRLAQRVASVKDTPAAVQTASAVKTSMLATATSAERHIGGVSLLQGFQGLIGHPADVVTDYLASLGRPERRSNALAITPKGIRIAVKAFSKGAREFGEAMRTGVDPETVGDAFTLNRARLSNPILEAARQRIQTFVSARNKPFYAMALQTNLYRRAKVLAIREGLKGAALSARVDELLAHPSDEMAVGAIADADKATLAEPGVVDQAIGSLKGRLRQMSEPSNLSRAERARAQALREGLSGDALAERKRELLAMTPAQFERAVQVPAQTSPPSRARSAVAKAAYVATELTAPFPRVAANIVSTGLDYSPVGVFKAALESAGQEKGARIDHLREGLTKAGVGSAAGLALGYYLASKGRMTGDAPQSQGERNVWQMEGKQAFSVRIGDRWYPVTAFAPISLLPILGASLYYENQKHPGETTRNLAAATMAHAKALTEHSILSSLRQVGDLAADPAGKISKFLAGYVPVPPLVGQLARGTDPMVRDASDPNTVTAAAKSIGAKLPGVSRTLPPRLDAFGRPVQRAEGPVSGTIRQLFDPTGSTAAASSPVLEELDRLGVGVSKPSRAAKVGGQKVERSPEQLRAFLQAVGPQTEAALEQLVGSPEYRGARSDGERIKMLQYVLRSVRADARGADAGSGGSAAVPARRRPATSRRDDLDSYYPNPYRGGHQ